MMLVLPNVEISSSFIGENVLVLSDRWCVLLGVMHLPLLFGMLHYAVPCVLFVFYAWFAASRREPPPHALDVGCRVLLVKSWPGFCSFVSGVLTRIALYAIKSPQSSAFDRFCGSTLWTFSVVHIAFRGCRVFLTRISTWSVLCVPGCLWDFRSVYLPTSLLTEVTVWRLTVHLLLPSRPLIEIDSYPSDQRWGTRGQLSRSWSRIWDTWVCL